MWKPTAAPSTCIPPLHQVPVTQVKLQSQINGEIVQLVEVDKAEATTGTLAYQENADFHTMRPFNGSA